MRHADSWNMAKFGPIESWSRYNQYHVYNDSETLIETCRSPFKSPQELEYTSACLSALKASSKLLVHSVAWSGHDGKVLRTFERPQYASPAPPEADPIPFRFHDPPRTERRR